MDYAPPFQKILRTFVRVFPPPRFLVPPLAGIDISDASVKHIVLAGTSGNLEVRSFGTSVLPRGAVVDGKIKNITLLADNLRALRDEKGIHAAHFALPEEHAYLFQLPFPALPDAHIEEAIEFSLKENVPLAPEEVVFSYLVGRGRGKEPFLVVSAYPRQVIGAYLEAAHAAGIAVLSFETEGHAIARASLGTDMFLKTMLMLDLGWNTTGLSIVREGVILFSTQLETTGKKFCRAIEEITGKDETASYAIMKEQGLLDTKGNEEVFGVMMLTLEALRDEMEKHLAYWNMHAEGNLAHEAVHGVVVAGSTVAVPGFLPYLGSLLSVPLMEANVWQGVCSFERYVPPVAKQDSYAYATAIGLALRSRLDA